jgi:hypothetical protein
MSVTPFGLPRWFVAAGAVVLVIGVAYVGLREYQKNVLARITVREAFGTVRGKEYLRFDEANRSYVTDRGTQIEVRPGDEQWRIYYQIDSFNRLDDSLRSHLLRAEKERVVAGRFRFWIESKEWCEGTEAGDRLTIRYQWHGGDDIEVIGIENPKYKIPQ